MAINKILTKMATSISSHPHRGADITYTTGGASSGTHLHVGPTSPTDPSVGQVAIWDGTAWISPGGPITTSTSTISSAISPSSRIASVKHWANGIATEDNDIIQLRKKNGIIYVMKTEVCRAGTWERLDPNDEPVIIDVHGKNLEEKLGNPEAKVVDATTAEIKKEEPIIPNIPVGWYQDKVANLYKYEGIGSWDAPPKEWSKLLNLAESGTLEYIG